MGGIAVAYESRRCREILTHRLIEGSGGRSPDGPHNVRATGAAHNGELSVAFRLPRLCGDERIVNSTLRDRRERRAHHGITKRWSKRRSDRRTSERWHQHQRLSPKRFGWSHRWIERRQQWQYERRRAKQHCRLEYDATSAHREHERRDRVAGREQWQRRRNTLPQRVRVQSDCGINRQQQR